MRSLYYIAIVSAFAVSCGKTSDQHVHDHGAAEPDSTNTILYNQVMDIHDEVMPKMEDLYNLKKDLQSKLAGAPTNDQKAISDRIARIDSASNLMMDWMHEFNPPADTANQEEARAYLEIEMEKVRKVKEAINEVVEENAGNQ